MHTFRGSYKLFPFVKGYEIMVVYPYTLTTEKQTTKFSSANLKKKVKSKLYHIDNSKTIGQTV